MDFKERRNDLYMALRKFSSDVEDAEDLEDLLSVAWSIYHTMVVCFPALVGEVLHAKTDEMAHKGTDGHGYRQPRP